MATIEAIIDRIAETPHLYSVTKGIAGKDWGRIVAVSELTEEQLADLVLRMVNQGHFLVVDEDGDAQLIYDNGGDECDGPPNHVGKLIYPDTFGWTNITLRWLKSTAGQYWLRGDDFNSLTRLYRRLFDDPTIPDAAEMRVMLEAEAVRSGWRQPDAPLTNGVSALVSAMVRLPVTPGHKYAALVELSGYPDRVLELVADELLDAHERGEIKVRPTVKQVTNMVLAAMRARHVLHALPGSRRRR